MFENLVLHELYEKQARDQHQFSQEVAAAKELLIQTVVSTTLDNWETLVVAGLVDHIKTMVYNDITQSSFSVELKTGRLNVSMVAELPLEAMIIQIMEALKSKIGIERVTFTPLAPQDEYLRINLNIHIKL
jgi:hypothetical protein